MDTPTASSWDSYMDTLLTVLEEFKPCRVLEFGSGKSTGVLAMCPSVDRLITHEHDMEYFSRFNKAAYDNLEMRLFKDEEEYAYSFPRTVQYDLIFVDGVNRQRCLKEVKDCISEHGVIMLHDAAREQYEDSIRKYKYSIFTDGGHTVCLTDNEETYDKLRHALHGLVNMIGIKT